MQVTEHARHLQLWLRSSESCWHCQRDFRAASDCEICTDPMAASLHLERRRPATVAFDVAIGRPVGVEQSCTTVLHVADLETSTSARGSGNSSCRRKLGSPADNGLVVLHTQSFECKPSSNFLLSTRMHRLCRAEMVSEVDGNSITNTREFHPASHLRIPQSSEGPAPVAAIARRKLHEVKWNLRGSELFPPVCNQRWKRARVPCFFWVVRLFASRFYDLYKTNASMHTTA